MEKGLISRIKAWLMERKVKKLGRKVLKETIIMEDLKEKVILFMSLFGKENR